MSTFQLYSQFAPPVGEEGSTAISKDSSAVIAWATEVIAFERGLEDITNPEGPLASFGEAEAALFEAEGTSVNVVSLGDAGRITLGFDYSIKNEEGPDFAVFENSFSDDYLEFAHVEVSSDGERFVRLPSICNINSEEQLGPYETCDGSLVHNLAGKYRQGFGTPFDLEDIKDSIGIDIMDVGFVRIVDVVGSIYPDYGSFDSEGNIINDPFKTDFESGGFDLDAVGVIHNNDPSVSINEEATITASFYPNPSNGVIYIKSKNVEKVIVLNLEGKEVFRANNADVIQLPNNLNNGIYIVCFEFTTGQLKQEKLHLNR